RDAPERVEEARLALPQLLVVVLRQRRVVVVGAEQGSVAQQLLDELSQVDARVAQVLAHAVVQVAAIDEDGDSLARDHAAREHLLATLRRTLLPLLVRPAAISPVAVSFHEFRYRTFLEITRERPWPRLV